jgi:putative PIN family toxin of toxin-antitoxin system
MLKIVVDTNLWIRVLLGGRKTLPILEAWREGKFKPICSETLVTELDAVWRRPRLRQHIAVQDAEDLIEQLRLRSIMVELKTIPPRCRDPKDQPVLATAIDGYADAIVTGDDDLRADETLRHEMAAYGVQLWGIDTLFEKIS